MLRPARTEHGPKASVIGSSTLLPQPFCSSLPRCFWRSTSGLPARRNALDSRDVPPWRQRNANGVAVLLSQREWNSSAGAPTAAVQTIEGRCRRYMNNPRVRTPVSLDSDADQTTRTCSRPMMVGSTARWRSAGASGSLSGRLEKPRDG
jgi:hypothetical protein